MATFHSGNGGYIEARVNGTSQWTRFDDTKWTLRCTKRLTENTHSGVSATNFSKVVDHNEWTIELPYDTDNQPDLAGSPFLAEHTDLKFHAGNSGVYYELHATSCESEPEIVNDNSQDIVRCSLSGKGGAMQ